VTNESKIRMERRPLSRSGTLASVHLSRGVAQSVNKKNVQLGMESNRLH